MEHFSSWYAVYTSSRAEKRVKERLNEAGIENYLPLRTEIRRWSDRKKKIETPLISGYVFVCVTTSQFLEVLNTPGVVTFLKEKSIPVAIPDIQIKRLKFMVEESPEEVEFSTGEFHPGDRVEVKLGRLTGLTGELVEIRGKYKIAVRLEHFGYALTTIPVSCVEKLSS